MLAHVCAAESNTQRTVEHIVSSVVGTSAPLRKKASEINRKHKKYTNLFPYIRDKKKNVDDNFQVLKETSGDVVGGVFEWIGTRVGDDSSKNSSGVSQLQKVNKPNVEQVDETEKEATLYDGAVRFFIFIIAIVMFILFVPQVQLSSTAATKASEAFSKVRSGWSSFFAPAAAPTTTATTTDTDEPTESNKSTNSDETNPVVNDDDLDDTDAMLGLPVDL